MSRTLWVLMVAEAHNWHTHGYWYVAPDRHLRLPEIYRARLLEAQHVRRAS